MRTTSASEDRRPPTSPSRRWRSRAVLVAGVALAGLLQLPATQAEDIDIFARLPGANDLPNVLLVWDSSANWGANISVPNCSYSDGSGGPKASAPNKEQGTKFAIEKCAIYNVIAALPTNADGTPLYNVGLMLFNESTAPQGGYPRIQFQPLTAANKTAMLAKIRAITIGDDKANNGPYAQTLHEAYLMFTKRAPLNGTLGTKWDDTAVAGGRYVGPPGSGCGTNHIIFLSNGSPNENSTRSVELLTVDHGDVTPLTYPNAYITNSDQGDWADEFARFLRGADVSDKEGTQSIVTHGVAVVGSSSDGLYPNFIRAIATQGGGQYYAASDIDQLVKSLLNIFNSIQTANSVFASASLPISVTSQGTYKNQVYVGLFKPDDLGRPRWTGNLKQYQILYDITTDSLSLGDAQGAPALNSATGFFRPSATSFWTTPGTFWANDLKGTPKSASDSPDGEVAEKGGSAEVLRIALAESQENRKVLTCIGCLPGTVLTASATERFVDANTAITSAMMGAADAAERASLIAWARGADNAGDERGPGGTTTVRPSIHGDVLHSRPAVVDYGGTIGTVVFYGGNDGMIHAIDGNKAIGTPGQELWSFVPAEFVGRFKRLRDNSPEVRYPISPPGSSAVPRDYSVDGAITVYQKFTTSRTTERVVIYVTMRRGGRVLYAFDVTDPTQPKYLWRKSNSALAVLGQTWSDPRVAKVAGNANPVLVMGAGYDAAAEDLTPPGPTTMGNAVVVLDAFDGTTLRTLATERSVPAAVSLMDSDFDGFTDRAYAVDLGGNVYRIDFETSAGATGVGSWTIEKFASLSTGTRKFFYPPDVVQARRFTAVLVGSGNRETPLATSSADRFYTLLDYRVSKGPSGLAPMTNDNLVPNGGTFDLSGNPAGCYLGMDVRGEKVVTAAVSTGGFSYFSTNRPTEPLANSCAANLGLAKTYRVPLFCGAPESIELAGGGLPPSPVAGLVEVIVPAAPGTDQTTTRQVPFIIGGFNPELSGLAVSRVPINVDPTRKRTYWFTNPSR
jgi:type IV pilus assembly protein PilY1